MMRKVGVSQAKANFCALLKEAARGETIVITKRGHPVARLTALEAPDREAAVAAAETLRSLRERIGWATTADILQMRNEGRRRPFTISANLDIQAPKRHIYRSLTCQV